MLALFWFQWICFPLIISIIIIKRPIFPFLLCTHKNKRRHRHTKMEWEYFIILFPPTGWRTPMEIKEGEGDTRTAAYIYLLLLLLLLLSHLLYTYMYLGPFFSTILFVLVHALDKEKDREHTKSFSFIFFIFSLLFARRSHSISTMRSPFCQSTDEWPKTPGIRYLTLFLIEIAIGGWDVFLQNKMYWHVPHENCFSSPLLLRFA